MRNNSLIPVVLVILILVVIGESIYIATHRATAAKAPVVQAETYHCPMHPNYLANRPGTCPICGMNLVPVNGDNSAATNSKAVRIDPAMIQSSGVATESAELRTLSKEIRTSAVVTVDERRKFGITSKVMGYIEKLYLNDMGQKIRKGQPLYELYSPELVTAQAEYLQALNGADSSLLKKSARQKLLNLDMADSQIRDLEKRGVPFKTVAILSPVSGVVTEKMILAGQSIDPGMALYTVVDYSTVRVECAIYQQDIPAIHVGQKATVLLDYFPGEQYVGAISYIAPELEMESKTVMARLELKNSADLKIKPGMNATVTIHNSSDKKVVTVSEQAVIRSGLRTLVVIANGDGSFEPREVTIGQSGGGFTEIIAGIREGETVVTSSQFLIDSESNLKSAVMKMNGNNDTEKAPVTSVSSEKAVSKEVTSAPKSVKKQVTKPVAKAGKISYSCPMHPEVVSDTAGSCPKCGMKLVEKKKETKLSHETGSAPEKVTPLYLCPMHPEVTDTIQSRCPKCGMKLMLKK